MRDFNELAIFTLISRELSFTRAADYLEISKAAASKAISRLENRLGTRLFERTSRRLHLTEAGETFLAYAQRAMEEADDGEAAVSRLTDKPRGTLRVAMPVTLAQGSVAPKLARFLRRYPELRLDITLKGGQIDPIAQRVDVALQTAAPEVDSQVIQKRIITVQLGLYASPRYLSTGPLLRSPEDLAQHSCVTLTSASNGTTWTLYKDGKAREVRLRGRIAIGDPVIHKRLCLDAVGIAILPNWLAHENCGKLQLLRVLPEWTLNPIELYVLYPSRLSMTPKLKAFLKFIEGVVPRS